MRLDLLLDVLVDAECGIVGENLFVDQMTEVSTGVLVRVPLEGIPICAETPRYYRGPIQAIVRASTHAVGDALMGKVVDALTIYSMRFTNEDGSLAMKINQMIPRTMPLKYPRSDGNGLEWSVTFDCVFVLG